METSDQFYARADRILIPGTLYSLLGPRDFLQNSENKNTKHVTRIGTSVVQSTYCHFAELARIRSTKSKKVVQITVRGTCVEFDFTK